MKTRQEILKKLEYFTNKADSLFLDQMAYKQKAAEFDEEYHKWLKEDLGLKREQLHPAHFQKLVLEMTHEFPENPPTPSI